MDEWAREWRLPRETTTDLRLLVSEVVTNSVRHGRCRAGQNIEMRARAARGRVHVEVADPGPGFRRPIDIDPARPEGPSGWGVFLLGRLTSEWGATRRGDRTVVWFDVPMAS